MSDSETSKYLIHVILDAKDDEDEAFHTDGHSPDIISKGEEVPRSIVGLKGGTPSNGTDRWDGQERRRGDKSTLGDEPENIAGEAPSGHQMTQWRDSSSPDKNCSDENPGNF